MDESIIQGFSKCCYNVAKAVNKQLFDGERKFFWIGGVAGGMCDFDDCDVISTDDMIRILRNEMTYDQYAEWRDANSEHSRYINLASWFNGLRHDMINSVPEELTENEYIARSKALYSKISSLYAEMNKLFCRFKKNYPIKKGDRCRWSLGDVEYIFDYLTQTPMGCAAVMHEILPDGTVKEKETVVPLPLTKINSHDNERP